MVRQIHSGLAYVCDADSAKGRPVMTLRFNLGVICACLSFNLGSLNGSRLEKCASYLTSLYSVSLSLALDFRSLGTRHDCS